MEKIKWILLTLVLIACQKDEQFNKTCMAIRISNALPVQFWLNGEESYNEKDVCGITKICFCQPFECDDPIKIQITESLEQEAIKEYYLSIIQDSTEIATIPFDVTSEIEKPSEDPGNTGVNYSSGNSWTPSGFDMEIDLSIGEVSRFWLKGILEGQADKDIEIMFTASKTLVSGFNFVTYYVRIYNEDFSESVEASAIISNGTNAYSETLTPTFIPRWYGVRVSSASIFGTSDANIKLTPIFLLMINPDLLYSSSNTYSASFTPSDLDICNESISIKIFDETDTEVGHSDCLSILETHICTQLVAYRNDSDFAGMVFDQNASPVETFYFRFPAVFFHPSNTSEQEDIELSDETIVRLYDKLEEKKLLDIGHMPHYMHRKLQMILMMDHPVIDDLEWLRRDEYAVVEGNKRYPLKRATVLLTDKNFIKENQL